MKKGGGKYRQVWNGFSWGGRGDLCYWVNPTPSDRQTQQHMRFCLQGNPISQKTGKKEGKKSPTPPFLHRIMCCGKTTVVENAPIVFSFSPLALLPERRVRLWDNNGCIRTATFFPYTHTNCCNMDGHGVRSIYAPNQTYRH